MATHKGGYIFMLVMAWISFVAVVVIGLFAQFDARYFRAGLYRREMSAYWTSNVTELTPAGWIFNIWTAIYIYQFAMLIYLSTTFGRKDAEDEYVYTNGPTINWSFYLFLFLANGVVIAILFLQDRNLIVPAAIVGGILPIMFSIMNIIATDGMFRYQEERAFNGIPNEYRLIIGFVQNAVGLAAGWSAIQATLSLSITLRYTTNNTLGDTIALVAFIGPFAALTALDLGILEKFTRFVYTPYIAVVYGWASIFAVRYQPFRANYIVMALILALSIAMLFLKIILSIVREVRDPLFADSKDIEKSGSDTRSIISDAESVSSKKSDLSEGSINSVSSRASKRSVSSRGSNISGSSRGSVKSGSGDSDY